MNHDPLKIPIHKPIHPIYLQIPRPQRLTNRAHPTRHAPTMSHLIRQRLLQRTLRHARVVQIAKTAPHARRALTPFPRFLGDAPLPGRKRRQRWPARLLGLRLYG